jgi:hypothetical protein
MSTNNGEQAKTKAYNRIKEVIEELGSPGDYMWQQEGFVPEATDTSEVAELFEGQTQVEHHGGEGQGEDYYTVWHFPIPDVYINFYGWYASHSGSEYEGMEHVEPKEVMVTQYHKYKG